MTQPSESQGKEPVSIGFCLNNHDRRYRSDIGEVCGPDALSQILQSKEVDAAIGDIHASVYRSGCLRHCSSCRAAEVAVGEHQPEIITYQSAEELKRKLALISARNPEKWARIETLQREYFSCLEDCRHAYVVSLENDPNDENRGDLTELRHLADEAFHALQQAFLPTDSEKTEKT